MKLAVTGGLGFIGSNFIRHMLTKHKDCRILNIDKKTYAGNPANLSDFKSDSRYSWVKADIADRKKMLELLAGFDAVVNFAAETHVDRSLLMPDIFIRTNVVGLQSLLDAARVHNVQRFVHIGTDEVYGSIEKGDSREEDVLLPNSPYSVSKASADLLARAYFATYKMPVLITRCSNNFGPYQYPEKAIPLLITNALEDKPFPLYGDGKNVRDWLFVIDHARAIETVLLKGRCGEIYNIGGGASLSNNELVHLILKIMGKPESLIHRVTDRPGHDRRYALDCGKIRRELGWQAVHSFEEAIRETVAWYCGNENWWRPLKKKLEFKKYYAKQYVKKG